MNLLWIPFNKATFSEEFLALESKVNRLVNTLPEAGCDSSL